MHNWCPSPAFFPVTLPMAQFFLEHAELKSSVCLAIIPHELDVIAVFALLRGPPITNMGHLKAATIAAC